MKFYESPSSGTEMFHVNEGKEAQTLR